MPLGYKKVYPKQAKHAIIVLKIRWDKVGLDFQYMGTVPKFQRYNSSEDFKKRICNRLGEIVHLSVKI